MWDIVTLIWRHSYVVIMVAVENTVNSRYNTAKIGRVMIVLSMQILSLK